MKYLKVPSFRFFQHLRFIRRRTSAIIYLRRYKTFYFAKAVDERNNEQARRKYFERAIVYENALLQMELEARTELYNIQINQFK